MQDHDYLKTPRATKSRNTRYCCVPQCRTYGRPGISFHLFPKDITMKKKWEIALNMGKPVSATMRVCSRHFLPSNFYPNKTKSKSQKLFRNAVPSLNIPKISSDKEESLAQKRKSTAQENRAQIRSTKIVVPKKDVELPIEYNNKTDNNIHHVMPSSRQVNLVDNGNSCPQEDWSKADHCDKKAMNKCIPFRVSAGSSTSAAEKRHDIPEGKVVISRVYYYLCAEYEQLKTMYPGWDLAPLFDVLARTARATGVSQEVVTDILLEEKRTQQPPVSDDDVSPMEEEPSESEDIKTQDDQCTTEIPVQYEETQQTAVEEQAEEQVIETIKVEIYEDEYQCSAGEATGDDSHVNVKTEPPDEQLTLSSVPSVDPLAAEVPHAEVKVEPHTEYPSESYPSDNSGDRSPATRDTKRQKLGT